VVKKHGTATLSAVELRTAVSEWARRPAGAPSA
jgi:hypothetical protein